MHGVTFSSVLFAFQILLLILYATLVDYDEYKDPALDGKVSADGSNALTFFYPMFQDVHVMIFVGFGFLMTFLKKYSFSSVGYNFMLAAVIIQWATLTNSWIINAIEEKDNPGEVKLSVKTLITSDFTAGAILISFGAVLGKTSKLQLLIMGIFEAVFFAINEAILVHYLKITDVGGSMVIHSFGAYFGIALTRVLHNDDVADESEKEGSNYHSDIFAMVGTIFLWLFWPSFNGGLLGPGPQQNRAVINTYFSLAACCVTTFIISPLLDKKYRLNMVHIQNATLAGGVAVGASADLIIKPWGAMLLGILAGAISSLGYRYVTPFLNKYLKIHDTCGVNNLHGMPGILAAIAAAIAAAAADVDKYKSELFAIWPARAPAVASKDYLDLIAKNLTVPGGGDNRSASEQAGFQFAALLVTLAFALGGGLLTGFAIKFIDVPDKDQLYDDLDFWEVPEPATEAAYEMDKRNENKA